MLEDAVLQGTRPSTGAPFPITGTIDGIFWGQAGGNWFVARNALTNYGLEGVAFNGGPAVAVANQFKTHVSLLATCALYAFASFTSVSGTSGDPHDHTMYFVGNAVEGGRYGVIGAAAGGNSVPCNLHFTGNSISVYPAFNTHVDYPGALLVAQAMAFGNVSGNKLVAGEEGIRWLDLCTNSIVLKNDFAAASWRGLDYYGSNGVVRSIQVLKNVLNLGESYHLKLRHPDGGSFFLRKNVYTNGVNLVEPFLDAAASPVHFIH